MSGEIVLVVADPGDVPVRPEQRSRHVEGRGPGRHVPDAIVVSRDGEPTVGVQQPEVETLTADWRVHVRGVAGQQHAAHPVAVCESRAVAEPGQPARRVHPEVGAGPPDELSPELVEVGWEGPVRRDTLSGYDDAVPAVAERAGAQAQLRGSSGGD